MLYTFGAPRVGDAGFAFNLSTHNRLSSDNIHRVYHSGDPVARVPFWPFVHSPQPTGECYVGKSGGYTINPMQHKMSNYIKSVGDRSWQSMQCPHPTWDFHCIEWATSPDSMKRAGLNLYNLTMASKAIQIAIKKVLTFGWNSSGTILVAGATALDQLSYLLDKAANISDEDEGFIRNILKRILKMCGVTVREGFSLTFAFIHYALRTLMFAIATPVNIALSVAGK